jgi:hypothetical protein
MGVRSINFVVATPKLVLNKAVVEHLQYYCTKTILVAFSNDYS